MKQKKLPIPVLVLFDLLGAAVCVGIVVLFTYLLPQSTQAAVDTETDNAAVQQFVLPSSGETSAGSGESTADSGGLGLPAASQNSWSHTSTAALAAEKSEISTFLSTKKTRETVQEHTGTTSELKIEKITCTINNEPLVYFSADIYVTNTNAVKSAFANATYGRNIRANVRDMIAGKNALLAISGDSYGESQNACVIRNGTLYSSNSGTSDVCVLYQDGTMKTFLSSQFDADTELTNGAWQAWTFGPALLDGNGEILSEFHTTEYINKVNPRCAIGYLAPGHYKFVLVDGRQDDYSVGVSISQLAALMQEEGCLTAYNLDGGKSAVMLYNGEFVNHPIGGGRTISDCIYLEDTE